MPITPDYPCYCGFPWEDAQNCPICGATAGVLVCTDCHGLIDSCYFCEEETPDAEY